MHYEFHDSPIGERERVAIITTKEEYKALKVDELYTDYRPRGDGHTSRKWPSIRSREFWRRALRLIFQCFGWILLALWIMHGISTQPVGWP